MSPQTPTLSHSASAPNQSANAIEPAHTPAPVPAPAVPPTAAAPHQTSPAPAPDTSLQSTTALMSEYATASAEDAKESKSASEVVAEDELSLKAKLLATLGWRLASCGAETRLIVQSVKKMAHDLGCHSIDLGITRDGILVKVSNGHRVSVEFMEIKHFVINMDSVARLHEICLQVSEGKLRDLNQIFIAIRDVHPHHYNRQLIILIDALAAAGFAYLNGGDIGVCVSAVLGGLVLMFCRFLFIKRGFFESFTFMLSACIGSFISSLSAHYLFDCTPEHVTLAATATTLLLVPGFPFLNGFLDIFKGYVPIGIIRLVIAVVLVLSAALGLLTTTYLSSWLFAWA